MSDLIEQHFDTITKNGLNTNFFNILESAGVSEIKGYLGALKEIYRQRKQEAGRDSKQLT